MSPIFIILFVVAVASAVPQPEPVRDCGPYSAWVACGTECPVTCSNYKNGPQVCIDRCKRGCVCIDGRIKKTASSLECVLPEECD